MNEEAKKFERQPGETARAFEAFCVYREGGAARSLVGTAQKLAKNSTTIKEWSAKWAWVERAAAFDADVRRRADAAEDEALKRFAAKRAKQQMRFRDDQVKIGREMIAKGRQMLKHPLVTEIVTEEVAVTAEMVGTKIAKVVHLHPTRWTTDGAGRLVDAGARLLANGLQMSGGSTANGEAVAAPQQAGTQVQIYLPEKKGQATLVVERNITPEAQANGANEEQEKEG